MSISVYSHMFFTTSVSYHCSHPTNECLVKHQILNLLYHISLNQVEIQHNTDMSLIVEQTTNTNSFKHRHKTRRHCLELIHKVVSQTSCNLLTNSVSQNIQFVLLCSRFQCALFSVCSAV